jgi:hypothetical protein
MAKISPELAKAIENIEVYKKLVTDKVTEPRRSALLLLIDKVEETLVIAPSSTRTEYHGAFPGGLVDHSIKVLKTMGALNKTYEANIDTESLVVVGLFHDIGKCGTVESPYYLPKLSDWHNKQGIMYEINPTLVNMPVSLRSLFLLQSFGVKLSSNEHYAISSVKDRSRTIEENVLTQNEPMLAVILQQAVRVVSLRGSGRSSIL